jgi:hypothetical protein
MAGRWIKSAMSVDRLKDGFLVPTLMRVMAYLMRVLPMGWLGCAWSRFRRPSASDTESYVLAWLALEVVASCWVLSPSLRWLVAWPVFILASLRIAEIVVRTVAVTNVISATRTLVLAAINFLELMLCFGLIYALSVQSLIDQGRPAKPIAAFYFSVITQLTVGYGDVYPKGYLRLVAAMQGLVGVLFVISVLARAVAAAPIRKDRRPRWPAKPPGNRALRR